MAKSAFMMPGAEVPDLPDGEHHIEAERRASHMASPRRGQIFAVGLDETMGQNGSAEQQFWRYYTKAIRMLPE